ncbi:type IV secretory system conjugative DNA transfer family protein [Mesorhizobium sp. M1273]|uniref:type IV secretory system conjugative DNA transfer family protein n=1 Tax=Mesorhizobium sp. M1273 TaxID=2957075 RepID=UPI003335D87A
MQLPPTEAIIMISGQFPIRAKKARYFADPRLAERVLPSASCRHQGPEGQRRTLALTTGPTRHFLLSRKANLGS